MGKGIAAKKCLIGLRRKRLFKIGARIGPLCPAGRLAALAVGLYHLQLEGDGQIKAKVIFGDDAACAVHPAFAVRCAGKDGVCKRAHGDGKGAARLAAALFAHRAVCRRHGVFAASRQGFCHLIAPRHAVGGIALQLTGPCACDRIAPGIPCLACFVPHHCIAARRHFLFGNGVALAGLGVGIAAYGKRDVPGAQAELVAVIAPLFCAGKRHGLARRLRGVQEGGPHIHFVCRLPAAVALIQGNAHFFHRSLPRIAGLAAQNLRRAVPGHAPCVIAAQGLFVFRDGVLVRFAVGRIDIQIFKPQGHFQRGRFILCRLVGRLHLGRAPRQALHGL